MTPRMRRPRVGRIVPAHADRSASTSARVAATVTIAQILALHASRCGFAPAAGRNQVRRLPKPKGRHVVVDALVIASGHAECLVPDTDVAVAGTLRLNAAHAGRCGKSGFFANRSSASHDF